MSTSAPETPTDEVTPPKAKAGKPKPTAANRYQLFDDEEGDYRVFELVKADSGLPKGAMLPIPNVPGFTNSYQAKKFVDNSGNLLEGKQVMIIKGLEICRVDVETVVKVKAKWKPKKAITGPAVTESGGR